MQSEFLFFLGKKKEAVHELPQHDLGNLDIGMDLWSELESIKKLEKEENGNREKGK